MERRFFALGAIFAFLGVALGAFGAHALRARLSAPDLEIWEMDGSQGYKPHAVVEIRLGTVGDFTGQLKCQASFAAATGPEHGHYPGSLICAQQAKQVFELLLAADKRCNLGRQVVLGGL